ncbi:hypothetical protein HanRHA438_Chr01g0035971 [Helianthus annuus]|uniref:Uncharacterized protein n=1 Tax=Helianthus annuus TaxID=4232 RepID=A0A9K3JX94_HELAN|nr:hypothetical protein HanXRQr2_Chr01g0035101 [Helianthus annuus]KAJ0949186.1 hypothetical protein HanRHA438_Chr01g0035971 [Helianthus annuus]
MPQFKFVIRVKDSRVKPLNPDHLNPHPHPLLSLTSSTHLSLNSAAINIYLNN